MNHNIPIHPAMKHLVDDALDEEEGNIIDRIDKEWVNEKSDLDLIIPISKHSSGPIADYMGLHCLAIPYPGGRDGDVIYNRRQLTTACLLFGRFKLTQESLVFIIEQLKGNYAEAATLWERYAKAFKDFRSAVKNDVTSLEAASRKTTEAVQKMQRAYADTVAQLNSIEMQTAISNAERLADALRALEEVKAKSFTLRIDEEKSAAKIMRD
jgi:hypothetical protein